MKVYLDYETFKQICLSLSEKIKDQYNPEEIVAVTRGGISAAHIMSKALKLPVGYFFPNRNGLMLSNDSHKRIVIVEDLVAQGRTLNVIENFFKDKDFTWNFVPVLVDAGYTGNIPLYGMKTPLWVVFPYEEFEKMPEGDRGLFRNGTDAYKE